jgi:pilus assembly protein CpaC
MARIAAAALLTVALSAVNSSAIAQNAAPPAAVETTLVKLSAEPGAQPQKLLLPVGKGAVIELDRDARDVFAANPLVVDAAVRTPRRIFVMARAQVGATNLIVLGPDGTRIGTLEIVVVPDVNELNAQMARELPGSRVKAEALNDSIVLNGTVLSAAQASQAQQMATRVAGQAERVVNGLRIEQATQVMIQVRVAEMSRTIAKQFGVNVAAGIGQASDGTPIFTARTQNQFSLLGRALAELSGFAYNVSDTINNDAQALVQALERVGLVRSLAEPNLTAVSGEAARFLVGGEFPIPVSRDRDGNIVVQFKPYGVGLSFTPVVLDKGHISLQLSTEVSELTNVGGFSIEGLTIPGIAVRRAETTVELPSGGTLVVGGLLQQNAKQNIDGFPGLKDLPILGALFRSRDFQNSETELVVMVTAYLVDPTSEARLARPTDGFVLPTDLETILQGRLNAVYGISRAAPPAGAPRSTVGYIIE